MISIPITAISSAAKNRKAGYFDEVMKRGIVSNSSVSLSEEDFNYIKNNFALGDSVEAPKIEYKKSESKQFIGNLIEKKSEPLKAVAANISDKTADTNSYNLGDK